MISQSLSLPMTTPTVPIGVACLRRGMLVLSFSGKLTLARVPRLNGRFYHRP
jgi:hypothetical protein